MEYGLIGQGGDLSFIRRAHNQLGEYDYSVHTVAPYELRDFLAKGDFLGVNIAEPYKEAALPVCHEISPEANKLRCVNLIVRDSSGKLIGHNTDYQAMLYMLDRSDLKISGKKVIVYGSSGNASAAVAAAKYLGAREIARVSWRESGGHSQVRDNIDAQIIVNAVRSGMNPGGMQTMVNLDMFESCEGVVEASYLPMRSALMLAAKDRGIPHTDPVNMLAAWTKYSSEIFMNRMMSDERIRKVVRGLRRDMSNIVLVGMPGCGKTTLGRYLSQKLGRGFLDVDTIIEQRTGAPVSRIVERDGEPAFRDMEARFIGNVGKQTGKVISVSSGAVLAECNYANLRKNGIIIFIERQISKLMPSVRPPIKAQKLEQLYLQRLPRFLYFADCTVENTGTIAQAGDKLLEAFFAQTDKNPG